MSNQFIAPKNWRNNLQWFESVPVEYRRAFAEEFCRHTFIPNGQNCVIIGYPRLRITCRVPQLIAYDMDSGNLFHVQMDCVRSVEKGRATEESDFHRSAISSSDYCDEANDISDLLFP